MQIIQHQRSQSTLSTVINSCYSKYSKYRTTILWLRSKCGMLKFIELAAYFLTWAAAVHSISGV